MPLKNDFFKEISEQSRVKSEIVAKYFDAWARVIVSVQNKVNYPVKKLAYIDLFAGPGRYDDGTISTPLLILEKAIKRDFLRERLITLFNDKDEANKGSLEKAIESLPGIELLKHQPKVYSQEVGSEIVKMFEKMKLIPTLFFVDPWGYKGLSLRLVNSVIKDWGSDCIFFFNYRRINMGLSNSAVKEHMDALFGEEKANKLKALLRPLDAYERERVIIEELCQAIKALGPKYVLPFCFKDKGGKRTSHHLIFVSKDFKGYEIMKEIMANMGSGTEQGVPSFEYTPIDSRWAQQQPFLFQLSQPLDDLYGMLLKEYSGQTLSMIKIYEHHNVNRRYIKKNYKSVLLKLEEDKKIQTSKHKKGTFGDTITVTFPKLKKE